MPLNDPVDVRPASPDDLEALWPLTRDFATSFTVDRAAFEESFGRLLADADTLLLVAEVAGLGVAGYLLATRHLTLFANGPVAWVEELMVDERARRSGVGRRLMARAEDWAGGCAYVALATRRAAAFYLDLGYEESATYFRKVLN